MSYASLKINLEYCGEPPPPPVSACAAASFERNETHLFYQNLNYSSIKPGIERTLWALKASDRPRLDSRFELIDCVYFSVKKFYHYADINLCIARLFDSVHHYICTFVIIRTNDFTLLLQAEEVNRYS